MPQELNGAFDFMGPLSNPRLDRAITLAFVQPIMRLREPRPRVHVPILMYHGICDPRGARHPYFETNTSPQVFETQMRFLHERHYTTTDLPGALASLSCPNPDKKEVVITFDDGHRDFFTHALPILVKYKLGATLFVITDLSRNQRAFKDGMDYMTWDEIRQAHSSGIRIGSHSASHPQLYTLSPAQIDHEIGQSKQILEDKLGASISSFSYPYAFPEHDRGFVSLVKGALAHHGYENGVSTIIGTARPQHGRFFLPRVPINSYDDPRFFQAKLAGDYDWLHAPQWFYKNVRGLMSLSANWSAQAPTKMSA